MCIVTKVDASALRAPSQALCGGRGFEMLRPRTVRKDADIVAVDNRLHQPLGVFEDGLLSPAGLEHAVKLELPELAFDR